MGGRGYSAYAAYLRYRGNGFNHNEAAAAVRRDYPSSLSDMAREIDMAIGVGKFDWDGSQSTEPVRPDDYYRALEFRYGPQSENNSRSWWDIFFGGGTAYASEGDMNDLYNQGQSWTPPAA